MKKIFYIANIRIPTEKAHGIQIMRTCNALANEGVSVTLVVPDRPNNITVDPFEYYGITRNFEIVTIKTTNTLGWGKFGYILYELFFSRKVARYVKAHGADVIYSRDLFPLLCTRFLASATRVYEAHTGDWNIVARHVLKKLRHIVTITNGLKDLYVSKGVAADRITVIPDAVDVSAFSDLPNKDICRTRATLPLDRKIAMYVGSFSLYDWKGLDIFLETARISNDDIQFAAVGGNKKDIEKLQQKYPMVTFFEKIPHVQVPLYLRSADVLIIPNKSGNIISEKYTSPMKLFEYMASGVPIVASRLPSICEVLNESNAVLVRPNDPASLLEGVKKALSDDGARAIKALQEVGQRYSWQARAQAIVNFIS